MSTPVDDQYVRHLGVRPEAELFPLMQGTEFDQLIKDIRENGQRIAIVLHPDGRILDGRNRELACVKSGIRPMTIYWDGNPGDELNYVISCNLHRRHLDTSQRTLIGAEIANMRLGDNQHKEGSANFQILISSAKAAEIMNVSERQLNTGRMVIAKAPKNVIELVRNGQLSVHRAAAVAGASDQDKARIASLPADQARTEAKQLARARSAVLEQHKMNPSREPSDTNIGGDTSSAGSARCANCGAPGNWREMIGNSRRRAGPNVEESA
jgi:hypothetical protein